ncbi:MAG: hypothetical protein ABJN69_16180 [Hellea sp.]
MFIGRLMREEDAYLQFEVMSWLIKRYGPPQAPKVPSPIHKTEQLSDLCWHEDDVRTVFDWAQDSFGRIKSECGMEDWSIQIAPQPDERFDSRHMQFSQSWNTDSKEPYYVDGYGRPVIHYDPRHCEDPGYFAARVIIKLAEIKLMNFTPERGISPLQSGILTLTAVCYMRQGFALAALPDAVTHYLTREGDTAKVPPRIINNTLVFSNCLMMLSRKLTPEQIVASYGCIIPKAHRKKIRPACKQIESYTAEIKVIRLLANPTRDSFENRSYAVYA